MSFAVQMLHISRLSVMSEPGTIAEGTPHTVAELVDGLTAARVISLPPRDWRNAFEMGSTYAESMEVCVWPDWPPPLPFPTVWLSSKSMPEMRIEVEEGAAILLGFLLDEHNVTGIIQNPDQTLRLAFIRSRLGWQRNAEDGRDAVAFGYALYAVMHCIDRRVIATVRTRTSKHERRRAKRLQAEPGLDIPDLPMPRDYHRVKVRDGLRFISEAKRAIVSAGPSWALAHRHDVRAPWRLLVRRGLYPLETPHRRHLEQLGYWVGGTDDEMPDDLEDLCRQRAITRRAGWWMAVRKVRVSAHTRGPADRPHVPSEWTIDLHEDDLG